MRITGYLWLEAVVDKIASKHDVTAEEVEEVFADAPRFLFAETGDYEGEDVYLVLGQTDAGRYLVVFFIYKKDRRALILSARDMTNRERRRYGRK